MNINPTINDCTEWMGRLESSGKSSRDRYMISVCNYESPPAPSRPITDVIQSQAQELTEFLQPISTSLLQLLLIVGTPAALLAGLLYAINRRKNNKPS